MRIPLTAQQRTNPASQLFQSKKRQGITRAHMAEVLGLHSIRRRRYAVGTAQPLIDDLEKIALPLPVSADALLFGETERDPEEKPRPHFEAVSWFSLEDQRIVIGVFKGVLRKHEAEHWSAPVA